MFSPDKWFGTTGFYNGVATQSLRFNQDDNAYLSRTPSSASNLRTFTFSVWLKRGQLDENNNGGSSDTPIISATDNDGTNVDVLRFLSQLSPSSTAQNNMLMLYTAPSVGNDYSNDVLRSFRDVSSWYHIVMAVDSTQASLSNRVKFYVNGELQTGTGTYYGDSGQNYDYDINNNGPHNIGRNLNSTGRHFDGYMSEVNFVDGTQLDASYFGETKGGVWIPKLYTGSYGTNGYRLEFKGVGGSADANGIGADTSGNGNHWSINNLGGHDSNNPDCPENNFVTMNVLHYLTDDDHLAEAGLRVSHSSTAHRAYTGTHLPRTGKWYWEVRNDNNTEASTVAIGVGFQDETQNMDYATGNDNYVFYCNNNNARFTKNTSTTTLSTDGTHTPDAADVIQVAYDADSGKVFIGINDTYIAEDGGSDGNPAAGTNETATLSTSINYLPFVGVYNNAGTVNFGQDDTFGNRQSAGGYTDANRQGIFKYNPPIGFLALCANNFEEPTIGPNSDTQPEDHFEIVQYTGNGSDGLSVTGVGFQPDWIWIKNLKDTDYHRLYDSSRGAQASLSTALTNESEQTSDGGVKSFDSDGFTLGSTSYANRSAGEYVAWNWKANGGTTSSFAEAGNNPGGTIQTNVTAGFSIITYTGTGGVGTIAHGLGVAPRWVLVKRRDGTGWSWYNQHAEFLGGNLGSVYTNSTALGDDDNTHWNDTAPTSSVVTLGTSNGVNQDNGTYVMYVFAEVKGYSKFDTYAADNYGSNPSSGSVNGAFIHTGFRPSFVMLKNISNNTNGGEWVLLDDSRNGRGNNFRINPLISFLEANTNSAEFDSTSYPLADFVSNGFKLRTGGTNFGVGRAVNRASGDNYIYMAFAHQPFKYANAF